MKKLFLFFAGIFSVATVANAQDGCMAFFPTEPGTIMVSTNYDSSDNMLSTMTYRVNESYDYMSGSNTQIGFTFADNTGRVTGTGNLDASCNDGDFSMKMNIIDSDPYMMNTLAQSTELVGNFLDYPNTFSNISDPFNMSPFQMDGGEYTIKSKGDNRDDIRVRVYNRQYEKSEIVNTPAGSFNASKVSFDYDVTRDGQTVTYKGSEWFAPNAGIVKTETYDKSGNRLNYSQLTTLRQGEA